MDIPDSLRRKMALFRANGRVFRDNNELFGEASWLQVMVGQRVLPQGYHPMADLRTEAELDAILGDVKRVVAKCVDVMPTHAEFIASHCAAVQS